MIHSVDYSSQVKLKASRCKQQYPDSPIIVVGNASSKTSPRRLKYLELAGQKLFNRKMSDELVRDVGAVKYVEYLRKSGRGLKNVIDEIVFAYFSKLKDEEDRERMKKEADEIRRQGTKRNLYMFEKFLDVVRYF